MFKIMIFLIAVLVIFLYVQNNIIVTKHINISSDKLPQAFDGFKIIHLSDLHGKFFGKNNNILVSKIKKVKPDLIVITGDLIDYKFYDEGKINNLTKELAELAPVYFVTGNHEITNRC